MARPSTTRPTARSSAPPTSCPASASPLATCASSAPPPTARRTCSRRCWGRRCARATPSGARRRWRASRAWPRPSATSSTCCWSATCAASPASDAAAACHGSPAAARSPRPRARSGRSSPTPTACPAGGRARPGSRTSNDQRGGKRSQWTKVLETAAGRGRARRLPLHQRCRGRALRLGAAARRHPVRAPPAQLGAGDRPAPRRRAPRSRSPPADPARPLPARLADDGRGQGGILDEALDGIEQALERRRPDDERSAAARLEVVGLGRPLDRSPSWTRGAVDAARAVGELQPWQRPPARGVRAPAGRSRCRRR